MNKLIKVLHYGLSENRGGIETYLNKLWKNIDKDMFQFDFINTNIDKACFEDEFKKMGSIFYKVTPRNLSITKNRRDLEKIFLTEKIDVLHCHLNTLSYIEPIKVAIKFKCKVIVHSRSSSSSNSILTRILHYINYIYLNTVVKNKITRLAVSNSSGEWLFGKTNSFQVINNSVDIEKFRFNEYVREQKRNDLKLSNKYIIGHIGALNFSKNHEYLFKVFREFLKLNKDSALIIVGDGKLSKKLKKLANKLDIADNIFFLGVRTDLPELLSAMDVLIFPSRYEGFPNVVLEAQTSGLPCYISDSITNEVVLTENCKTLSIREEPRVWAKKIFSNNTSLNRKKAFKNIIEKGFSINNEILRIETIYLETLGRFGEKYDQS